MNRAIRTTAAVLAASLLAASGPAASAYAASTPVGAGATCRDITIPVALSKGADREQTIAATLCTPARWAAGARQVDVLVPGTTYTKNYWDWPQDPARYSYVRKTLGAGRATLSYDRLGTGESSRPPSARVGVAAQAYILHQLVAWLDGRGYPTINAVGHSLGSIIAVAEAGRWRDVDKLVVTGALHRPLPGTEGTGSLASFYPAALDPAFAHAGPDPGYLTTLPGQRGSLFYDEDTADPDLIAHDERRKDVVSTREVENSPLALGTPAALNWSSRITAPVLIVMGESDALFCDSVVNCSDAGAIRRYERPFYDKAAGVDVVTVPGTGHNVALHPSADRSFRDINTWLENH